MGAFAGEINVFAPKKTKKKNNKLHLSVETSLHVDTETPGVQHARGSLHQQRRKRTSVHPRFPGKHTTEG